MILDKMEFEDLVRYENCVKNIENRELLCGFLSGYDEISNWNKCELFQFCMDTVSIYGNLDEIIEKVSIDDINKSVRDKVIDKLLSSFDVCTSKKFYCKNSAHLQIVERVLSMHFNPLS